MDKDKAKEILEGGKTNSLTQVGTLVNDPSVVIQLFFDGEEYNMVFGSYGLTESKLDYVIHREKSLPLNKKEEYYTDVKVEADIYTLEDEEVKVERYRASPDGWDEV